MKTIQLIFRAVAAAVPAEEKRFNAISNKRSAEVGLHDAGKLIRTTITSANHDYWDERITDPTTGEMGALKDIYSFDLNKSDYMDSPDFAAALSEARALELAGDLEGARKAFNELLNNMQLSYGVINRDGKKPRFFKDQVVDIFLSTAVTKDGRTTLIVKSVAPVAAQSARKNRKFGPQATDVVVEQPALPVGAQVPA